NDVVTPRKFTVNLAVGSQSFDILRIEPAESSQRVLQFLDVMCGAIERRNARVFVLPDPDQECEPFSRWRKFVHRSGIGADWQQEKQESSADMAESSMFYDHPKGHAAPIVDFYYTLLQSVDARPIVKSGSIKFLWPPKRPTTSS